MQTCPTCLTACDDAHRFCHSCGGGLPSHAIEGGADPLLGVTLRGGYVLEELIAEGSVGRIYRASQPALGRTVAVKIIHPHLAGDDAIARRFVVEARAASRINHPNAVTIFAFGDMNGQPYIVMQLVAGKELSRLAEDEGPLPILRVADLVCQMLAALEQAHAVSIVHGDVKPDNILVERPRGGGDLVKVIDFGLAQVVVESDPTAAGAAHTSPEYVSPELARGERVDGRSDLYSTGVVLYELLTGSLPFDAESTTQTLLAQINEEPMDPRERAPSREIPDTLARVARRALQKRAADRFQSASDFADAIVNAVKSVAPRSAMKCRECGSEKPERRAFCGECGARLARSDSTDPRRTTKAHA